MPCGIASPVPTCLRRGSFSAEDPTPWKGWERVWEAGKDTRGRLPGVVVMGAPLDGQKVGNGGESCRGMPGLVWNRAFPAQRLSLCSQSLWDSSPQGMAQLEAALWGGRMLLIPWDGAGVGMAA